MKKVLIAFLIASISLLAVFAAQVKADDCVEGCGPCLWDWQCADTGLCGDYCYTGGNLLGLLIPVPPSTPWVCGGNLLLGRCFLYECQFIDKHPKPYLGTCCTATCESLGWNKV